MVSHTLPPLLLSLSVSSQCSLPLSGTLQRQSPQPLKGLRRYIQYIALSNQMGGKWMNKSYYSPSIRYSLVLFPVEDHPIRTSEHFFHCCYQYLSPLCRLQFSDSSATLMGSEGASLYLSEWSLVAHSELLSLFSCQDINWVRRSGPGSRRPVPLLTTWLLLKPKFTTRRRK